jgi:hypothetical protein
MKHWTRRSVFGLAGVLALVVSAAGTSQDRPAQPGAKEAPVENKNTWIKEYKDKLELSASTFYQGWPVERAFDGNADTSWFSASNDAVAQGTSPWVQVAFPEDVTVTRVTILGNREAPWQVGYSILAGSIELKDKDGKRLHYEEGEGVGDVKDFQFKLKKPLAGVRSIRFTSLGDQGDKNPYADIAIGEFQVE